MTTFYAKYPAPVDNSAAVSTVQGEGTPGTPVGGVLTIQGDPAGTPVPVSGTVTATNPSVGLTGAAVPTSATYVGMLVGGNLVPLAGTANGLKVDGSAVTQPVSGTFWQATQPISAAALPLPAGASTLAGQAAISAQLPATLGAHVTAASLAVNIASDQVVSVKGVGLASGVLVRYAYGSGTVTTAAYTQIIASTAAAVSRLYVFDSSGSAMIIATGAAASEVDKLYVPPGGTPYPFEIAIPAGTRVSLKALDVNASTGQFIATGLT